MFCVNTSPLHRPPVAVCMTNLNWMSESQSPAPAVAVTPYRGIYTPADLENFVKSEAYGLHSPPSPPSSSIPSGDHDLCETLWRICFRIKDL
jgi:hypothetical protein